MCGTTFSKFIIDPLKKAVNYINDFFLISFQNCLAPNCNVYLNKYNYSFFTPVTPVEVKGIISKIMSNSWELLGKWMLNQEVNWNQTFLLRIFPSLKESKCIPIYKNRGSIYKLMYTWILRFCVSLCWKFALHVVQFLFHLRFPLLGVKVGLYTWFSNSCYWCLLRIHIFVENQFLLDNVEMSIWGSLVLQCWS